MYDLFTSLSRRTKRAILLCADITMVVVALLAAHSLRYGMPNPISVVSESFDVIVAVTAISGLILQGLGVHRIKLQHLEIRAVGQIGVSALLMMASAMIVSYLFQSSTPRSVPVIFGIIFFVLAVGYRVLGIAFLTVLRERTRNRIPVAIYGAGAAGIQIASALRISDNLRPVAFIDDNHSLHGLQITGLTVRPVQELDELIARQRIQRVILAIPSLSSTRRREILGKLNEFDIEVQMLPSHAELLDRNRLEDSLKSVQPDDLLGRDKVDLDVPAVAKAYAGRSVMVTGAGGSIGSELCRQLADCRPRRIVLFEHSEFALYNIDKELRAQLDGHGDIDIRTRLGSITNKKRVEDVIRDDEVEIILHAAAYKHVPLVEDNELEGVRNNVLGTRILAEAACAAGAERFILVSTDKAVRPTNIMGATKRMAEMVVQDLQTRKPNTKLAMVRFGNVLGSSGSVLPLFQSQIERGGPVTVTHPEVTRYFMTIPEAARLVLLAGAFVEGGDVYVLDMGKPMKIMDIAHRMIELAGQKVRAPGEATGIEVQVTGLRPGEKLYEELLIDSGSLRATPHQKILRAEESCLSEIEILAMLQKLQDGLANGDPAAIRRAVEKYVDGYHREQMRPAIGH